MKTIREFIENNDTNARVEMSAPIGIGVKISAGGDVSLNRRTQMLPTT
jgi:hypothetical protein